MADQPRDEQGRFGEGSGGAGVHSLNDRTRAASKTAAANMASVKARNAEGQGHPTAYMGQLHGKAGEAHAIAARVQKSVGNVSQSITHEKTAQQHFDKANAIRFPMPAPSAVTSAPRPAPAAAAQRVTAPAAAPGEKRESISPDGRKLDLHHERPGLTHVKVGGEHAGSVENGKFKAAYSGKQISDKEAHASERASKAHR